MSLFSTLALDQSCARGADSMQLGAGKLLTHAPLSKSAALRTIREGFNIQHVSDVDLISRRKAPPSAESMQNAAGSVSPERRWPDTPAVIRDSSLEHCLHRRHSVPPPRQQRDQNNLIVRFSALTENDNRIGCRKRGGTLSRSPNRSSSPRANRRENAHKRVHSQSRRKLKTRPMLTPQSSIIDIVPRKNSARALEKSDGFEGFCETGIPGGDEAIMEAIILCNQELVEKTEAFKAMNCSGWGSDDGRSTATGGSSPRRMFSSFRDCPTPMASGFGGHTFVGNGSGGSTPLARGFGSGAPLADTFGGCSLGERSAGLYERHMAALVKAQQKKAMEKVGK